MTKRHSRRSCKEVVAATAGLDNWKTWAGRSHGGDEFEVLDVFRGMQRKFAKRFLWKLPHAGTPCPVCYTEPETRCEWYITSACGHAVCIDCLQQYASSQVNDPEHKGPLKCPVCSLPLREKDAIAAMEGNDDIIKQWDSKIRDDLLRALPNYRHCPRCASDSADGSDNGTDPSDPSDPSDSSLQSLKGGGFVTAECLAPLNSERELCAQRFLDLEPLCNRIAIGAYFLYLYTYAGNHSTSLFVDLLNSITPFWLMYKLGLMLHLVLATCAKRALFKPIIVECPCCDESFILNAEAELSADKNAIIGDKATTDWIGNNTRPCPSCSAPISKSGGCNHMRCPQCKVNFCWACMRLRTFCQPYNCNHGAPYGSVGPITRDGNINPANGEWTMADRLTRMENEATSLNKWDIVAFVSIGITARDSRILQTVATAAITSFAIIFSSGFIMTLVFLYFMFMLASGGRSGTNNSRQPPLEPQNIEAPMQEQEERIGEPRRANRFQRRYFRDRFDSDDIAEAIQRSMEEY
eukprot:CAMPEP_0195286422 /NCGR_PEP_ID=MMETSP0707-20130614/3891_1 /TAXON_ID=33640 /ORGANISM="Asterionellopsis glacialis, Strain CCMP134" /LENGTH=522 /DNA_ID=CAMNT_0040346059 /DNA_START=22 /DNA_END=1590 /DNA_ORIENTATION=+